MSATTPPGQVKLWVCFGNAAKLALWLRFLGFAIYGREGHLSRSKAGPEIDDYTADMEARSYYFVSQGEARLVDVDVMDDRTSSYSNQITHRRDFRTNVIERDGSCVVTNDLVRNCAACHIIPHANGSHYISNAVRHRGGIDDSADDINDINDTRNGILLSNLLHQPFGSGQIAFLKTPNFALAVDDIPYVGPDEDQQSRLTVHHFDDLGPLVSSSVPHNFDARQPHDTSEWPPAVIVNFSYASAAMKAWSSDHFFKFVRERSKGTYYPDDDNEEDEDVEDIDNVLDSSGPSRVDAQMHDQTAGQSSYKLRIRNTTSKIPPKEMYIADAMDCVTALWMQSSRVGKPKPEDDHASTLARNESVKMWLQSIEDGATN